VVTSDITTPATSACRAAIDPAPDCCKQRNCALSRRRVPAARPHFLDPSDCWNSVTACLDEDRPAAMPQHNMIASSRMIGEARPKRVELAGSTRSDGRK
jgi:hypothetical protein